MLLCIWLQTCERSKLPTREYPPAIPQRRNSDGKYIQPVKEIAPKFSARDHASQIAIGCGYDSNIHAPCIGAAQPLEFSFLDGTQQLRLDRDWDIPDFIQKQGALVG